MLKSNSNDDLNFKRFAYEGLTTVINANFEISHPHFASMLAGCSQDAIEQAAHKEEIDLGAFKQKVDHGAPHRRAVYGLISAMVTRGREKISLNQVVDIVV